ncbi:MAG: ribonuclease HII [Chloroflexi bacterium]|nr:ribonuclease HII [Chloroflexota bacterium]
MAECGKAPRTASLRHERHYFRAGCQLIVGIDEAGRGPLAGPVAAAAVALPLERRDLASALRGLRDSKEMSAAQRLPLSETVKEVASYWGVGHSDVAEIDRCGIVDATKAAMQRALDKALRGSDRAPDCLFLDYVKWPERLDIPQVSIVRGDKHSLSIACASVLAKVWRDRFMIELDDKYSEYGFAQHKGYGTAAHLAALRRFGPCAAHRRSFKPVFELIEGELQ